MLKGLLTRSRNVWHAREVVCTVLPSSDTLEAAADTLEEASDAIELIGDTLRKAADAVREVARTAE